MRHAKPRDIGCADIVLGRGHFLPARGRLQPLLMPSREIRRRDDLFHDQHPTRIVVGLRMRSVDIRPEKEFRDLPRDLLILQVSHRPQRGCHRLRVGVQAVRLHDLGGFPGLDREFRFAKQPVGGRDVLLDQRRIHFVAFLRVPLGIGCCVPRQADSGRSLAPLDIRHFQPNLRLLEQGLKQRSPPLPELR